MRTRPSKAQSRTATYEMPASSQVTSITPTYTDYVIPQSADLVTFLGALLHPNTANDF